MDIWEEDYFRLFLSHKGGHRAYTGSLKASLIPWGISAFVAHDDVEPTREWQVEIESALKTMDGLAALMTADFHASDWTDQEVGAAVGKSLPIIPIDFGMKPYGFFGKYQALPGSGKKPEVLAREILDLLLATPTPLGKEKINSAIVAVFEKGYSFDHANTLMAVVEKLDAIPDDLIDRLENAPSKNDQLDGAWQVKARLPDLITRLRS